MKQALLVLAYLAAAVAGNLAASAFGPWATPFVGFFAIGFDLTMRDVPHQGWQERGVLKRNMGALIVVGSLLTVLVNHEAAQIALASTVAFFCEATASTLVYWAMFRFPRLAKMNAANCVGGAVDSLLFPTVAFGRFMPAVVVAQWAAKFLGGFVWSLVVVGCRARSMPKRNELLRSGEVGKFKACNSSGQSSAS